MKHTFLIIFISLVAHLTATAQNTFNWEDTSFVVGQTRIIHLKLAWDGPCTFIPCYDYSDNNIIYDTLVEFFTKNPEITLCLIWHTRTIGNSQRNLDISNSAAQGIINELKELGITTEKIAVLGLGESRPIIPYKELLNIDDAKLRNSEDEKNERVEIIITSVP